MSTSNKIQDINRDQKAVLCKVKIVSALFINVLILILIL